MDRLTYKIASEVLEYDWKDNVPLANLINRLGHYEDIGLAPEQLLEVDKLYAEKCREVAELKKRQRWIPVEERLPKLDEDGYAYVMVCMDDEFVATTDYTRDEGFSLWAEAGEVIAWMPLPEPYRIGVSHEKEGGNDK